jgi:hypothetical protein
MLRCKIDAKNNMYHKFHKVNNIFLVVLEKEFLNKKYLLMKYKKIKFCNHHKNIHIKIE